MNRFGRNTVCSCAAALLALVLTGVGPPALGADARGDEVVVVFNKREHGSEDIARHYAARRGVPERQVLGLRMPVSESISRSAFTEEVALPIADHLEDQGLWQVGRRTVRDTNGSVVATHLRVTNSAVRYLVLCRGVPLKIEAEALPVESRQSHLRPELLRNEAAVDSELSCLPLWRTGYALEGPLNNPVHGLTNAALIHPTNGVLMVARLDGPTVEIARGLVDRALEAETNGVWGRAYFDLRAASEPGMKQGDEWIRAASEVCRLLGFETVVETSPARFGPGFPMSQIAVYAGWYTEHVDGPFLDADVEFLPGALAYHLHSFSAATLRVADRHWVAPLLARGATVTLGCVHEPYLAGTPDIGLLVARLYYLGFTYGEAAYAAQGVTSWMTTVVGDPLFRPMVRPAQELHEALVGRGDPLAAWSHLRAVNLNLARGASKYRGVAYLEELPLTQESAVLSEKLAELYSELGKPASALRTWQAALELDPSPEQRIRLQWRLAGKLAEDGQTAEAMAVYQAFLDQNPNHPDAVTALQRLIPLASNLGQTKKIAEWEAAIGRLRAEQRP